MPTKGSFKLFLITGCFFIALAMLLAFPASGAAAKQGGILKIALHAIPQRLGDPPNTIKAADQSVGGHIFNTLVGWHYDKKTKESKPVPSLAEKWESSADGKVWTFYLRKGVTFHDGTPFNAEATKFNLDRTASKDQKTVYGRDLRPIIERTEVVDSHTLKVYLNSVAPLFLNFLAEFAGGMISPAAIKKHGDKITRHPTGTGPFKVKNWASDEYIELEANKDYWAGRPHLDGIIFNFVPDGSARINMLLTGNADVIWYVPVQDHERIKKAGKFDVVAFPTGGVQRLYLDCGVGPTKEAAVRKAMKLAIDEKTIVRDILQGVGEVSDSASAPFSWGYYPADNPIYDPEGARKLLEEAGWVDTDGDGIREKNGEKLMFTMISPPPTYYIMGGEVMMAIQQYLKEVGFEVKLVFEDVGSAVAKVYRSFDNTKGYVFNFDYNSRSDAWFILGRGWSGTWYPDKKFVHFYKNEEYDKLYEAALSELDKAKRLEIYKRMQEIWAEDPGPIQSIYVIYQTYAKRKKVHGISEAPVPAQRVFMHASQAWIE